jgi:hypothetical protein
MGMEHSTEQFKGAWTWSHQKIFDPCQRAYLRLPDQLTEIKKPYLERRESTRLLVLTAITLVVAGASRKCT